jgi:alkanesulfonate monooxygenase SsuD/methylene tetrahydromethanopterin reductase-like flavin-dependent oxidoreductase (luciferase family)
MEVSRQGTAAVERPTHPWVAAGQGRIRFGVAQVTPLVDWSAYLDFVREAEALGFDSYWTYDHPTYGFDCWTTLSAVAAVTRTMRVGTMTSCIYHRNPALLARMAADVDRVSGGRLVLGLGIGDDTHELAQLGIAVPPVPMRQQALEETVQIVEGLWKEPTFTFHGQHFEVAGASAAPGPMQQPHVPLMIAGGGERVTLRQVAQHGDVANMAASALAGNAFTLEDVRRKYAALRQHCEAVGRPYDAILRSYLNLPVILGETHAAVEAKVATMPPPLYDLFKTSLLAATPVEAIEHYRGLVAAGVQYFMASHWGHDLETLHLLAEQVIPAVNGAAATAEPRPDGASSSPVPATAVSAMAPEPTAQLASAKRRWWPWGR